MSAAKTSDRVVRAMTIDGAFRVIATVISSTHREAAATQGVAGETALRLGELMAGTILLRETMSPGRRVQIILKDASGGRLVADSLPDGTNRGLVNPGSDQPVDTRADATLQVNYTLNNGKLHQGVVAVPAEGSISDSLMRYMQESEQVVSIIAVRGHGERADGVPQYVGGFVVQLLPEAEHEQLAAMTEHMANFSGLARVLEKETPDPDELISLLLSGQEYSQLASSSVSFGCNCSRERMLVSLGSLAAAEIGELVEAGENLELACESCGQKYDVDIEEVGALLMAKSEVAEGGDPN